MSVLEDLKKNDLYAPYAAKLDQLLKGGPGSGPHPTGGGKIANKATKDALHATRDVSRVSIAGTKGWKKEVNSQAASAHEKAARLQSLSGNKDQAAFHTKMAEVHSKAAKE